MPIRLTKTVKILLLICFAAFLIQQTSDQFFGTHFLGWLGLTPIRIIQNHAYWQFFTYSFLHSDVMHLFFNLMMLAFIGSELEVVWGSNAFLRYYGFCAITTGLIYFILQLLVHGAGYMAPLIGASGAIYGLLVAYGLIFGERVMLFMMLFPMKAKHFVWVLALIQLMTTLYSPGGGVASLANLSGMLIGVLYLWGLARLRVLQRDWKTSKPASKKSSLKRRSKHLKLVVNNNQDFDSSDDDPENRPKTWH